MTPVKTLNTSQLTSPVIQINKAIETKVESVEAETETDRIQVGFTSQVILPLSV